MWAPEELRYRIVAVAVTVMCMNLYLRPMRQLGPLQRRRRHYSEMEMTLARVLALPDEPSRIAMWPAEEGFVLANTGQKHNVLVNPKKEKPTNDDK